MVKNPPANEGDRRDAVQSLGQEDLVEEHMATHTSIVAWRIPWPQSARLWFIGSQRAPEFAIALGLLLKKKQNTNVSGLPSKNGFCCGHENVPVRSLTVGCMMEW